MAFIPIKCQPTSKLWCSNKWWCSKWWWWISNNSIRHQWIHRCMEVEWIKWVVWMQWEVATTIWVTHKDSMLEVWTEWTVWVMEWEPSSSSIILVCLMPNHRTKIHHITTNTQCRTHTKHHTKIPITELKMLMQTWVGTVTLHQHLSISSVDQNKNN